VAVILDSPAQQLDLRASDLAMKATSRTRKDISVIILVQVILIFYRELCNTTSHPYSDLEVAPSTEIEVAPIRDHGTPKILTNYEVTPTCGLRKRNFWIMIIAAIEVVASAVMVE
jgi:hypothetical protein